MSNLYLSNEQLLACERLKNFGFPQIFDVGSHIGRGFADLGFEQFVLLPSKKIMSLFTGQSANFTKDEEGFFFLIPDNSDFITFLDEEGWECEMLECEDGINWSITINSDYSSFSITASCIWTALLEVCLQVAQQIQEDELVAN